MGRAMLFWATGESGSRERCGVVHQEVGLVMFAGQLEGIIITIVSSAGGAFIVIIVIIVGVITGCWLCLESWLECCWVIQ